MRIRSLLTILLLVGSGLTVFAQPVARFYIGETEKNLDSPANEGLVRTNEGSDMVIFRIGQKTVVDVEKALRLSMDGMKQGVGELIVVSALVSGDEVKSVGLSVPIPVGSHGRSRSRLGFLPNEMLTESSGKLSSSRAAVSALSADAISPDLRLWIAAHGNGLVTSPVKMDPAYVALKSLVMLEASKARKGLGRPDDDMLVMFATGSAQCDAACSAGTEVWTFALGSER